MRFEWVYDGDTVWVVQLHKGTSESTGNTIVKGGDSTLYIPYETANGINGLRDLIANHKPDTGIKLIGDVGITSHFGDLLRKANIPSFIVRNS